jgi:hypothetical protein
MQIISKNKDYYDHISHEFGIDPLIVFNRKTKLEVVDFKNSQGNCPLEWYNYDFKQKDYGIPEDIYLKLLVVCGIQYPLFVYPNGSAKVVTIKEITTLMNLRPDVKFFRFHGSIIRIGKMCITLFKLQEFWIDWHKKLDTPIFIIDQIRIHGGSNNYDITFNPDIPILKDIEFSKFVTPSEVYQNISQLLASQKEKDPPVEITDKDKILKSGFDKVKSFRHRK